MKNKKGAIELSMTTIIVIVLGVTLLVLGLTFIKGIFEKAITLTEESFRTAEKMIQEQMGSSDKFYISGLIFNIDPGDSTSVYVGVQNFGEEGIFKITVTPGGTEKVEDWFILPSEQTIKAGDKKGFPLVIKIPKGKEPGTSVSFTINALKGTELYDSQSIVIMVKE